MAQPVQEPSMEEILASIRRIIAGDDARAPAGPPARLDAAAMATPAAGPATEIPPWSTAAAIVAEPVPTGSAPSAPVLGEAELKGLADTQVPDDSGVPRANGEAERLTGKAPADAAQSLRGAEAHPHDEGLFEASATAPSADAFPAARTGVGPAGETLGDTVVGNSRRTLEELVTDMLRPILRSWLDDHLPDLVERVVKAEIERVSRGRWPPGEG